MADDNEATTAEFLSTTNSSFSNASTDTSSWSPIWSSQTGSNLSTVVTSSATDYTNKTSSTDSGTTPPQNDAAATVIAIIAVVVVMTACLVSSYCFIKKKGKLKLPCYRPVTRARRSSSSSSRRVLEENEVMENSVRPNLRETTDDMFGIGDYEDTPERHEGREEYYYDEVFGQSQFEDETTNNAMRHLYNDSAALPEDEMLDLDFETLGIKIEDYIPEPERKNTA